MKLSRKILMIGTKATSLAIMQALNLFVPSEFEYIDSTLFSNTSLLLDSLKQIKHRDDIYCIVLFTNDDDVEHAKHIRLTDELGRLRLLPIIVLSQHPVEYHLRQARDNIFLLSPELYLIPIHHCVTELPALLERAKPFDALAKMLNDLRPYIVWSDDDDIVSSHDNFNRFGPLQLMKELFSPPPGFLSQEYENMSSRLWFKKHLFMSPYELRSEASTVNEELFRKTIVNKRILYIDDEHRLGWSFALYSLLTENADLPHYQLFQDRANYICTSDSRFACIDSVEDALKFLDTYHDSLNGAFSQYSESEHIRTRLAEQLSAARKLNKETGDKVNNAESNATRAENALREAEEKLKTINARFKNALDDFLDASTMSIETVDIPDVLPQVKGVSEIYEQYTREANSIVKKRDDYKNCLENLEKQRAEFVRQVPALEEIEAKYSSAHKRYDESVRALSGGGLFPYDLVILDLRLDRHKDRDLMPQDISGVRVLRKIKKINPSIPVLMFTASEKAMNYQQAIDLGASGYWIKGINSLPKLKLEIINSLEKAEEARNLWMGIKRIEAKKQLMYVTENPTTRQLEKGFMADAKKAEIVALLKESYLLFIVQPTPFEQSVCNYSNFGKIALNMGMIQEERFSRIQDKRWDFWVSQKAREIDQEEIFIRQTRNKAAHKVGSGITRDDALRVFKKTLERCLKQ